MLKPSSATGSIRDTRRGQTPIGKTNRVLRGIAASAILLIGALGFGDNADAQGLVADRTEVVKTLNEKHGEQAQALGLASNGGVFELFTSTDGATWTIIMTMPNGKSSLVGEGQAWVKARVKPNGQPI